MVIRFFILILFFIISSSVVSKDNEKVILLDDVASSNSFISYVSIGDCKYILKQKKDAKKVMVSAVNDALASYIVQDLDIAHTVKLISAKEDIPGKMYSGLPATLHTIAPGKAVNQLKDSKYYQLCLKQGFVVDDQSTRQGLTETIIHQMTWHWQLPIIIAVDLFTTNTGRHRGNFFYDVEADRFCLIDMDHIGKHDVAGFACQNLDMMVNVNKKKFTKEEIKALVVMRDTLKFLAKKYPPDDIIIHLHLFAKRAIDGQMNLKYNTKLARTVIRHEKMIVQNYASVRKLIVVLDKIINNFYQ